MILWYFLIIIVISSFRDPWHSAQKKISENKENISEQTYYSPLTKNSSQSEKE